MSISSSSEAEDEFKTTFDRKIQETVLVVLEEFFKNEGVVLDYICATEDNRQASRDRMFQQWFSHSLEKDSYCMRNLSIKIDNVEFFSSVIIR